MEDFLASCNISPWKMPLSNIDKLDIRLLKALPDMSDGQLQTRDIIRLRSKLTCTDCTGLNYMHPVYQLSGLWGFFCEFCGADNGEFSTNNVFRERVPFVTEEREVFHE